VKKFKAQTRAGKVMCNVLWDREGVMLAEFFDRSAPEQIRAIWGDV